MPRPLSKKARNKAIEASQMLIAECGIEGFTMDGVAKLSGVAKTTLYRHWNSASELLVHALDCQVERIPTPDTGSLPGDLFELFSTMRAIINQPGTRQLFLEMASASARDPELESVKEAMVGERMRPIREIVRRAVERGEIPETDLEVAAVTVEGPFVARMFMSSEPLREDEVRAYIDFIARGLGVSSPIHQPG